MISHRQVSLAIQAYLGEIADRDRTKSATGPEHVNDDVVISHQARDLRKWTRMVAELPDGASDDRLQALSREVAAGSYRPAADDIADQILARSLADRLAGGIPTQ